MLTHSQDFDDCEVGYSDWAVGVTLFDDKFGHTGTEVARLRSSHLHFAARSTCPLEVHPPMSQRVYALTFLRCT
jgi:hypothetical protein